MGEIDLDKLSLREYIQHIHRLPWENFVAESVRKSITYYVHALYEKAVETKAKTIVELGVYIGQSTRALLKAAIMNNGHLYSIESNGETLSWVAESLKSSGLDTSFLTTVLGDDLEVVKKWTNPIDFLFIDTLHTYEQASKELEAYSKFITEKGIIVLHDIRDPLVMRAIDDWTSHHGEWVFEDITPVGDGWGLGLVRRKP